MINLLWHSDDLKLEPERTQLSEPARTLMIAFNLEEL